jgi:hypothetical protein
MHFLQHAVHACPDRDVDRALGLPDHIQVKRDVTRLDFKNGDLRRQGSQVRILSGAPFIFAQISNET